MNLAIRRFLARSIDQSPYQSILQHLPLPTAITPSNPKTLCRVSDSTTCGAQLAHSPLVVRTCCISCWWFCKGICCMYASNCRCVSGCRVHHVGILIHWSAPFLVSMGQQKGFGRRRFIQVISASSDRRARASLFSL